ncbi:MAG: ATP-binding protein [bacterium]
MKTLKKIKIMKKYFEISPRILLHLGEDLIKNESIALLELVKNSYDACASFCKIEFNTNDKDKLDEIIITDDGYGMSIEIIEKVWLTVGTDFKQNIIKQNKCNRIPLGEKGIGRLGVHKLGNIINLITKMEGSNEVLLNINWETLYKAKKNK